MLNVLRTLREQSGSCGKPADGSLEYHWSQDGGTPAYYYVDMDESLPANSWDTLLPEPYSTKRIYL